MSKKVYSKITTKAFRYGTWKDATSASVWKTGRHGIRTPSLLFQDLLASLSSPSPESSPRRQADPPLMKLSFSKILLFADEGARKSYFHQQSAFLSEESHHDDHFEFSPQIDVEGFRSKVLAVRSSSGGGGKPFAVGYFFFCVATLLGLSVPYRWYIGAISDELHVQIVKEVGLGDNSPTDSLWQMPAVSNLLPHTKFWKKPEKLSTEATIQTKFESVMRGLKLYD